MSTTIGGVRIADMPDLGTLTDAGSVVGEHSGSGRFQAQALLRYVQPFNVRTWGTNAAAIQAATNACHAAGGGVVYFPAGFYTVEQSIDVRGMSNMIFAGDGKASVITCTAALNGSDPNLYNDVFNANNLSTTYPNYLTNLAWQDLKIDCTAQNASGVPGAATAGYNLCAIECQNVNNVRFSRLQIVNAFGNAVVSGTIDPQLTAAATAALTEDCEFVGCVGGILPQYHITGSVVQYGAMRGGAIQRCRFINSGGPAIDVFNCFGTAIRGNYFSGSKGTPVGSGQSVNSIHSDFGLSSCAIEDNIFLGAGPIFLDGQMTVTAFNVIATPGPQNCSISRNKLYGAASANATMPHIQLLGGSSATALGNAVGNLIDGNNSFQAPASGIRLTDGVRNLVINNTISQCGYVNHSDAPFRANDSTQPGGGSKENRFAGNQIDGPYVNTNYQDNGANNTSNRFWDNRMETALSGTSTISTATLDKQRNYGPGSP
jgi:parallel beta-helix repeat protein